MPASEPRRSATILLVEDDRFLRQAAHVALGRAGYHVLTAADGEEGLRLARTAAPDIVLLDLLMPKLSGLEVLAALRAEEATRAVPVLVLSNSSLERTVAEVRRLGAEYIVKAKPLAPRAGAAGGANGGRARARVAAERPMRPGRAQALAAGLLGGLLLFVLIVVFAVVDVVPDDDGLGAAGFAGSRSAPSAGAPSVR